MLVRSFHIASALVQYCNIKQTCSELPARRQPLVTRGWFLPTLVKKQQLRPLSFRSSATIPLISPNHHHPRKLFTNSLFNTKVYIFLNIAKRTKIYKDNLIVVENFIFHQEFSIHKTTIGSISSLLSYFKVRISVEILKGFRLRGYES